MKASALLRRSRQVSGLPLPVATQLTTGTTVTDAPSFTTSLVTVAADTHIFVYVFWGRGVAGSSPPTVSTTVAGLSIGLVESALQRPSTRQCNMFVGRATASGSGTVKVDIPDSVNFTDINVHVIAVTNLHYVSAATDCIVQKPRLDSIANATSETYWMQGFADPANVALIGFMVGQGEAQTLSPGTVTKVSEVVGFLAGTAVGFNVGPVTQPASTWTSSASHSFIALELRTAGAANPYNVDCVPTGFKDTTAASAAITAVPLTAGRPVFVVVNSKRTGGSAGPSGVASASTTWAKVSGSDSPWNTVAAPAQRLTVWLAVPASTVTEDITITHALTQNNTAAVSYDLIGAHATGTAVQVAIDSGDADTTLAPTLAAFGSSVNATVIFAAQNSAADRLVPGDGFRHVNSEHTGNANGTNGSFWAGTSSRGVFCAFRSSPDTTPTATVRAAQDAGAVALEIKAA